MSKLEKAITRLLKRPTDYTWSELVALMNALGFELRTIGGSGRKFIQPETAAVLYLHEPHPSKVLKSYQIRLAIQFLRQEGRIP